MAGNPRLRCIRLDQADQAAEQRRLTRAARAQKGDDFARFNGQRHPIEHAGGPVGLREIEDPDPALVGVHQDSLARSQALAWSMAVTMARITRRTAKTRGNASRSMLFFSSWPMPPAPTMPSTVEARTLNSHM